MACRPLSKLASDSCACNCLRRAPQPAASRRTLLQILTLLQFLSMDREPPQQPRVGWKGSPQGGLVGALPQLTQSQSRW